MKLCIDCVWFSEARAGAVVVEKCAHGSNRFPDYVRGGEKSWSASWLRSMAHDDKCGPDAKWFLSKDDEQ